MSKPSPIHPLALDVLLTAAKQHAMTEALDRAGLPYVENMKPFVRAHLEAVKAWSDAGFPKERLVFLDDVGAPDAASPR